MLIVPLELSLTTCALPGRYGRFASAQHMLWMSPLQTGYVTVEAQRSQRKMPERVDPTHFASPRIFLKFSALPASQRCVVAVTSWMDRCPVL